VSPDPQPTSTAARYTLAGWFASGVAIVLLIAAVAAIIEQRGHSEATADVSAAASAQLTTTPTASVTSAPATASPLATESTATPAPTASLTPTATPTPTPTPTATPTAEPTPPPLLLDLRPATAGIGETFAVSVHAPEAGSATVTFLDNSYPLGRASQGAWFGVIGVPIWASLGQWELTVVLRDEFGTLLEQRSELVEVAWVERPVDYLTLTAEQGAILTAEAGAREREIRAEQFFTFDRGRRWTGPFRVPVQGITTTEFGQGRSINGGPITGQHSGTDIANAEGTPVYAAAPGRVAWTGEMPIRGNSVLIDHGDGVITGYHHLLEILVELDDEVTSQTMIAAMGSTGLSTGPHLHWELTIYGVNVDPVTWSLSDFIP
jgi:murein DD-endopeptidase MepM/ murein hydrolase activator NlpD